MFLKIYKLIISFFFILFNSLLYSQSADSLISIIPDTLVTSDTSAYNNELKPDSVNTNNIENNIEENTDSTVIKDFNNEPEETTNTLDNNENNNETIPDTNTFNDNDSSLTNSVQPIIYSDTLIIAFIKNVINQSPDSLYFNILKITNYTKEKISGELSFSFPDGWNLISAQGNQLELFPGDSAFIPVRLAIDKESVGSLSYVLNAIFKTDDAIFSTNAYITIPGYSTWTMSLNKSLVYFNQYNESETVKVKLSNKGNVTETIKLEYKVGKLIKSNEIENNYTEYISLNSNQDTTINITVSTNSDLSYNDRKILESNWKEASLEVKASSFDNTEKQSIWFKKLYSSYFGSKIGGASPLTIGINISNLLSDNYVRFSAYVSGTILLPKDRDIFYRVNLFGLGLNRAMYRNYNFNRMSSIIFVYKQKNFILSIGDNVGGGGGGVGFSGRGFKIQYQINKSSNIAFGLMRSRFNNNSYGGFVQYKRKVFNLPLNTGLSYANYKNPKGYLLAASVGSGFTIKPIGSFSFDIFGNTLNIKRTNLSDTLIIGYGFRLGYSLRIQRFNFNAYYQNYLRSINRGSVLDIKSNYTFKDNKKIDLTYNMRKSFYNSSIYNALNKSIFNRNDLGRAILYIPTNYSVTYGIGPYYNSNIRQTLDNSKLYMAEIRTYNPKLYFTANLRISSYRSLSGFFTTGFAYINYKSEDPSKPKISFRGRPNYSLGSTFSNKVWRLSVSYNVGSVTDLWYYINYQVQYPSYTPIFKSTQSIVIRPSYEKSFFENKITIQLMANYAYYLPSRRENLTIALTSFFNLNRGWSASINANLFLNSVEDEENGRISSKDLNLQVGIRKSFDIQQPRIKSYDLTIVCFKDLNGNKIKDENEPPLPNIQVTFQRTTPLNDSDEVAKINTGFAEIELITSPDGQVYYGNIPEGVYFINFKPLANLKDLYNVNGDQQTVRISSNNTTYFVPFAETYKVKGKVLIERDEFSSEGSLSFEGIRVTAIDPNGESYSVLTDKKGDYMLSVPQAQTYKVKVNQVFGEQFICERPEYNIHFNGIKVISLDFKFYEKKRKVNFDSAIDALYIFNSLNTTSSKTKLGNDGFKADIDTSKVLRYVDQILDTNEKLANLYPVSSVTDAGTVFKIDLYPPTNKRLTKEQVTLPSVICIEENSLYRYFANTFQNYQDAKDYLEEIQDLGVSTAKIVSFKDGKEISLKEAGVENE